MPVPSPSRPASPSPGRFLRVVGALWLFALLAIGGGVLLAPHAGWLADIILHHTVYWHWTHLTLQPAQPFSDASTPADTVRSYYSALYRGDAPMMERLTAGAFRSQMQQRLAQAAPSSVPSRYTSYVTTPVHTAQHAVVVEKFHLFWRQGLRFALQYQAGAWRITGVEMLGSDSPASSP